MRKKYIKLILCIVSGPIGLHYWFEKDYKKAILYAMTFGGFGVWYIYDTIKLIANRENVYKSESSIKKNKNKKHEKLYSDKKFKNDIEKIKEKTEIFIEVVKEKEEIDVSNINDVNIAKNYKEIDKSNYYSNDGIINNVNIYLNAFSNIKEYDFNKEMDENYIKKIKRNREVDYENFIKISSTNSRPNDFIVFDLETTGLDPTMSEIIEIGAIKFRDNMPVEMFNTLIKPRRKISERITAINGITNEMVEGSPFIEDVMPKFIDFIGDDVLIAHNAKFDMGFVLDYLYKKDYKKVKNKVVDTLKLSRQKVREFDYGTCRNKKLESYKLEDLKYEFGLYGIASHSAIDDCKVCAYIYMSIIESKDEYCYLN